jgi:hypothetical protein
MKNVKILRSLVEDIITAKLEKEAIIELNNLIERIENENNCSKR